MRRRVSIGITLAALLLLPAVLFAATSKPATTTPVKNQVLLVYHEDNSQAFKIVTPDKKVLTGADVIDGTPLPPKTQIVTEEGDYAELQITQTKTIIKISQKTNFTVDALRSDAGEGQDAFSLTLGKVRTVAGKASGKDKYNIKTQSAVCGVRGSDVVVETLDGIDAKVFTLEGTGWIQNLKTGAELDLAKGFFADTLAELFAPVEIPTDLFASLVQEMSFTKLNVDEVLQINKEWQDSLKAEGGAAPAGEGTPQTPPPPMQTNFMDDLMAKLREILGMEIGSITIGNTTWSKVVMQPQFTLGPLKMGLYLPIIYSGDMFNPADWYKPAGNNEWSFGTDPQYQNDTWGMVIDITSDLLLKIKYLEWGNQRDPFFFKLGNLNDITIGHGLIMRNFANDADFPAVRRVGVNIGLDFKSAGIEAMVNDAAAPDIFGGRVYLRPFGGFRAALGVSALLDWSPARDFNGGAAAAGDPIFINPGVDLDLPFVESDFFSLVAFADGAAMLPFFRSAPTAVSGISEGFALDAIYDPASSIMVKNWGVAAGLFGNLIIRDFTWRVEFRDFTGAFKPQFYNTGYERQRSAYVQDVLDYLVNPAAEAYNNQIMGIFGEGGLTLPKLFSLKLSYFWPWYQDKVTGEIVMDPEDHLVAKFTLEKGVIPVVNIWGTVSYERTKFIPTIMQTGGGSGLSLFDANTVVSAQVNYPVAPTLDVMLLYTTTAQRNPDGSLAYEKAGDLLPKMNISLAIETQVHF